MKTNPPNRILPLLAISTVASAILAQEVEESRTQSSGPSPKTEILDNRPDGPTVRFTLGDFTQSRQLHDADGDGWCDVWCAIFPEIEHRNQKTDTDGDGLTDYQEMVLWRDPVQEGSLPRKLTAEEIAENAKMATESKKLQAEQQAALRKTLEPILHEEKRDENGKSVSLEETRERRRQRLGQWAQAKAREEKDSLAAARLKAKQLDMPERFKLPDGGGAVLSGERNGLPSYTFTRSTLTAADTISVDELWPGGSTGFNLTGKEVDSPAVKIGVWEPFGPVVDHSEFSGNVVTVDSADATTGWTASTGGSVVFNGSACQEGSGCFDLRRVSGQISTLYSRQQPASHDFTGRTIAVWFYFGDTSFLAEDGAVEMRFGSSAGDYWQRSFDRDNLDSGWNLLTMREETATSVVGSPSLASCSYTALNVTYVSSSIQSPSDGQGLDYWRLSDTRVTNMDGASSVDDHSTHVTGIMASSGVMANAKGMAYQAQVQGRDALGHIDEMAGIFSNGTDYDDIFASNHSYGLNPGWTVSFVATPTVYPIYNVNGVQTGATTVQPGVYAAWFADSTVSSQEDYFFGRYLNNPTRDIDAAIYGSDSLLPVWAAGNDRGDSTATIHFEFRFGQLVLSSATRPKDGGSSGFDSMPPDSVAKNILTVGSIPDLVGGWTTGSNPQTSSFSSYGPTDDGRIKPDVCANGEGVYSAAYDDPTDSSDGPYRDFGGTSQAAPGVTGSIGLLVELLRHHRGDDYQPSASLLKGLVIHTADDILNPGPDYKSGWGLVNARKAAELVEGSETTHQGQNVRMALIGNGSSLTIPVTATGGTPVKVTVCSTDPAGTQPSGALLDNSTPMLVNDFQLKVISGGTTYHPFILNWSNPSANATTGINSRDNVEQVLIANPGAGQTYDIVLAPAAGETFVDDLGNPAPQRVAVMISGIEANPSLELRITDIMQTGADKFTLIWPALIGTAYRVQQSPDLSEGSWIDVTGDIVAQTAFVANEVTSDPTTDGKMFWRIRKVE